MTCRWHDEEIQRHRLTVEQKIRDAVKEAEDRVNRLCCCTARGLIVCMPISMLGTLTIRRPYSLGSFCKHKSNFNGRYRPSSALSLVSSTGRWPDAFSENCTRRNCLRSANVAQMGWFYSN
mgnify:CR=1 FL=1